MEPETSAIDVSDFAQGDCMGDQVDFYWDRRRTRRGALVLLAIGVCGLPLILAGDVDGMVLGIGWAAALTLLAGMVFKRGSDRRPVITISEDGFLDRRVSRRAIPWTEIVRPEIFEAEQFPFLGFDLRNRGRALKDSKPLVRIVAPFHRLLGLPAISINTSLLNCSDEDVMAPIDRFQRCGAADCSGRPATQ